MLLKTRKMLLISDYEWDEVKIERQSEGSFKGDNDNSDFDHDIKLPIREQFVNRQCAFF